MTKVSVIMLVNTADEKFYEMTENAINSLFSSECEETVEWDVVVVESNKESEWKYEGCKMVVPEGEFHYNRFLNIGIANADDDAEWLVAANNDVLFHDGWMSAMLDFASRNKEVRSMSPIDPTCEKDAKAFPSWNDGVIGYSVGEGNAVKGHCIVFHSSLLGVPYLFDEQWEFYGQDDDYGLTLKANGQFHCLIPKSKVEHFGKRSHKLFGKSLKSRIKGKRKQLQDKWRRSRA
jgi:GT2 family glycosyltransferase